MPKEIKLKITEDMIRRLTRLVQGDTDSADKNALQGILWDIAEQCGICDEHGNPKV
jgi:hypothetical protein